MTGADTRLLATAGAYTRLLERIERAEESRRGMRLSADDVARLSQIVGMFDDRWTEAAGFDEIEAEESGGIVAGSQDNDGAASPALAGEARA